MSMNDLFRGKLVRLSAEDPEKVLGYLTKWDRDNEYWRLAMDEPVMWWSRQELKEYLEKELIGERSDMFYFMIRSLEDDRVIGEIGLEGIRWSHGDCLGGHQHR